MALEPGPAPQLGHFLFLIRPGGARFLFFNSHFAGKVALEPGPAPHLASFFLIRTWGGRCVWHPKDTKSGPPPQGRSKMSKSARNGSGIDENQHKPVKIARNFDASPAVTTGKRQDP